MLQRSEFLEWVEILPAGMIPADYTSMSPADIIGDNARILRDWVAAAHNADEGDYHKIAATLFGSSDGPAKRRLIGSIISDLRDNGYLFGSRDGNPGNPVKDGLLFISQAIRRRPD